ARDDERACKRAAPGFVGAGDEARSELAIEREELLAGPLHLRPSLAKGSAGSYSAAGAAAFSGSPSGASASTASASGASASSATGASASTASASSASTSS